MPKLCLLITLLTLMMNTASAQQWTTPVRGSWVQTEAPSAGDVTLAAPDRLCDIVIAPTEHTAVQQAAKFLAGDIERITGRRPAIVARASAGRPAIVLHTLGTGTPPAGADTRRLTGQWEAYQVLTRPNAVHLIGSNFRGTAFAAYTLAERLGIDPLYHWTGYAPEKRATLVVKETNAVFDPPTFKYRGLFHDDEDILPRPFDPRNGYPYVRGTVPDEWYERYFETALRLRMNQVAPFVRVNRPDHIPTLASDWGLFYTSHHYDILLSNPYGFDHFGLAKKRGVSGKYDYFTNREGIERYWRGGVEELTGLDAIWPVGIRGTDDVPYVFPEGTTIEQKGKVFEDAIRDQIAMAGPLLPKDKPALYTLTLYNEMLTNYRAGTFNLPEEVMLIWDDNGDGIMRDLPTERGKWKHGVYYHLAFFGITAKQSVHTVTPMRIADEFRKIVDAGATEYMLLNVSELREHVMETRMIADICWDADMALTGYDPARRFVDWWCREYFGASAAVPAAEAYGQYYQVIDEHHKIWYASVKVRDALTSLMKKVNGEGFTTVATETRERLPKRLAMHEAAKAAVEKATVTMSPEQARFFFEHVWLGLAFDYYPTIAALKLVEALDAPTNERSWELVDEALAPLQKLEADIARAERPPFEGWYRPTWIRVADYFNNWSDMNPHRPYDMVRLFREGRTRTALTPGGDARQASDPGR